MTVIIVAGALIGDWLGIMGYMQYAWFWFGNQGLSYIQLGRAWQIGFFAGLLIWSTLMFRALWPTGEMLRRATRQFWSGRIRLENLIWAATLNIAVLYVFGMIPLTGIEKSFTINDFWRWWVVHLWVEQSYHPAIQSRGQPMARRYCGVARGWGEPHICRDDGREPQHGGRPHRSPSSVGVTSTTPSVRALQRRTLPNKIR